MAGAYRLFEHMKLQELLTKMKSLGFTDETLNLIIKSEFRYDIIPGLETALELGANEEWFKETLIRIASDMKNRRELNKKLKDRKPPQDYLDGLCQMLKEDE